MNLVDGSYRLDASKAVRQHQVEQDRIKFVTATQSRQRAREVRDVEQLETRVGRSSQRTLDHSCIDRIVFDEQHSGASRLHVERSFRWEKVTRDA
ncbi:MAG: hypothetical protein O3C40_37905 [Planctomycetota bacterium]|nr:hypothetical protein [Planctomycetota bacterium]